MQIIVSDLTLDEVDEALNYLRLKLQDKYGNRLNHYQREFYLQQVNDLLDARLELKANENNPKTNFGITTRPE